MQESTWTRTAQRAKSYPKLEKDISVDVLIIGGGITGATAAYLLSRAGKNVALITEGTTKDTTTAHTTGFLNAPIDTDLPALVRMFGHDAALNVWRSGFHAIDLIQEFIERENIDCEFMRIPQYFYARDDKEWERLREEASLAQEAGFPAEARRDSHLVFPNDGYMEVKDQGKFHALDYVNGLLKAAERMGAQIYENTEAKDIRASSSHRVVETKKGSILAKDVVVATYYPLKEPKELLLHTGPYTTYIIEAEMESGILPEATYQDENNPYHYFRVDRMKDHDRLIMGGEDHRKELKISEKKNFAALKEYMHARMKNIPFKPKIRWHWTIIEPIDGLPFIGPTKADSHQYVATAYSGTGLTFGTLAAEIISDSILGRPNGWAQLYREDRPLKAKALYQKGKDYVGEFLGGAAKNVFRKR